MSGWVTDWVPKILRRIVLFSFVWGFLLFLWLFFLVFRFIFLFWCFIFLARSENWAHSAFILPAYLYYFQFCFDMRSKLQQKLLPFFISRVVENLVSPASQTFPFHPFLCLILLNNLLENWPNRRNKSGFGLAVWAQRTKVQVRITQARWIKIFVCCCAPFCRKLLMNLHNSGFAEPFRKCRYHSRRVGPFRSDFIFSSLFARRGKLCKLVRFL